MNPTMEPFGSLPPAVARTLDEYGPIWGADINKHRDFVVASYTPVVAQVDHSHITVTRDIAYGPHLRQKLDVFVPTRNGDAAGLAPAGVVVFVHGGAFIRGKKSTNGHIYDNVSYWFASQGYVAVNVEYRLAPEAAYPAGAHDVADAVEWVTSNISSFGGSAEHVFLIGHSAGGTHVATCLFDPSFTSARTVRVRGAVLISARLRADVREGNPNTAGVQAYFGTDESLYEARSPVTHAQCSRVPLMIAIAEFENPYLDIYGAEFFYRAAAARTVTPRFIQMKRHNHTSIVAHFDSGEEYLGREITDFFFKQSVNSPHKEHP